MIRRFRLPPLAAVVLGLPLLTALPAVAGSISVEALPPLGAVKAGPAAVPSSRLESAPAAAAADPAPVVPLTPQLKPSVTLDADVIKLGDLWDEAGEKANVPLARAPEPGKRLVLEARWLGAVASAYGLDWRPVTSFERCVVERATRTIDLRDVEAQLRDALIQAGAAPSVSIELANRASLRLQVPASVEPTIAVRDLNYDPRMNRFTALIEAPADAANAQRFKVSGSVYASTRIPVLTHAMGRGEIISENDIDLLEVRDEILRRDVVTNARMLIGQEPRSSLRPGAPIRSADLQKPVVVTRNSAVTMIVRTPMMTLTAQGRAAEDGSTGDVIRVTNIQSKHAVDARVVGPGQVVVVPPSQHALAD